MNMTTCASSSAVLVLLVFGGTTYSVAATVPQPENLKLHVVGEVQYRCYIGDPGGPRANQPTPPHCDGKSISKTIIDEIVVLKIEHQPNPENSMDLHGAWEKSVALAGRQFTLGMSVTKEFEPAGYVARLVAFDDAPSTRRAAAYSTSKKFSTFNPLQIEYWSVGTKEEIELTATLSRVAK